MKKAICLFMAVLLMAFLFGCGENSNEDKEMEIAYQAAEKLARMKNYDEAIIAFEELGEYKDAAKRAKNLRNLKNLTDKNAQSEYTLLEFTFPDFAGRPLSEASSYLMGFNHTITEEYSNNVDKDVIIRTIPAAGATVTKTSGITIYVSRGKEPKTETPQQQTPPKQQETPPQETIPPQSIAPSKPQIQLPSTPYQITTTSPNTGITVSIATITKIEIVDEESYRPDIYVTFRNDYVLSNSTTIRIYFRCYDKDNNFIYEKSIFANLEKGESAKQSFGVYNSDNIYKIVVDDVKSSAYLS